MSHLQFTHCQKAYNPGQSLPVDGSWAIETGAGLM